MYHLFWKCGINFFADKFLDGPFQGIFWGGPLKISRENAHKLICPVTKNNLPNFQNQQYIGNFMSICDQSPLCRPFLRRPGIDSHFVSGPVRQPIKEFKERTEKLDTAVQILIKPRGLEIGIFSSWTDFRCAGQLRTESMYYIIIKLCRQMKQVYLNLG